MDKETPNRGPGFARMQTRLGLTKAEALRQQVLREQEAALAEAGNTRPVKERDRTSYRTYPVPRRKK